ncbi:glycosyltransferase family 4 protein [Streptomyces sp. NPDC017868]|uniref:glycosyltransferase family 4 protein n=1 Tax=Streptomyces sp. NPDC017868 TaxID=3365014 RepID=UPI00379173DA
MTAPLLVAVSGPDGADGADGSWLVRRLTSLLGERGVTVVTVHGHGCLLCRWFPVPPRVRDAGEPGGGEWARRATDPQRQGSRLRRAHALLHAGELAARLTAATLLARTRARGRSRTRGGQAVVMTDRGPLDGLVAFDPPTSSGAASAFRLVDRLYGLTLLLGTGTDTPRGRGREETTGRARYRNWSQRLSGIARLDDERAPSLVAGGALERILDEIRERERAAAVPERGTAAGKRRHVVVSVYEDADDPACRGGGVPAADRVARRLAEDFRVTVVTAGRRGGTEDRDGVHYVRLPVGRAGPRAGPLLFLALLPFVARRIRHDLWLESFTPPFSTGFLPLATTAPVVGVHQGLGTEAPGRHRLPFSLVERLGLRCYRHIVVRNTADGPAVRRLSPRADVQVIPHGVEQRQLDETRPGAGRFILFLGRIDTWTKGLDLLLDAYDRARPPLDLLLAGSGTPAEEHRLAALVTAHARGPEPRIHWVRCDGEDRRRQLLRDSAFLVLPSRHETFGLVALEGMSYGKPVLHFDLPALRWMHDGGDVAVPPFDVAAFGARMTELATDTELRRGLGHRSGIAAQHYTWDEMTGRYLALAHRLVDSPAAARRPRKRGASWQTTH